MSAEAPARPLGQAAETEGEPASAAQRKVRLGSRLALYLTLVLVLCFAVPAGLRMQVVLLGNALVLLGFVFDAHRLTRLRLTVQRSVEARIRVLGESHYTLTLHHAGTLSLKLKVRDTAPPGLRVTPALHELTLREGDARLHAQLFAEERGRMEFGDVFVEAQSSLGLCSVLYRMPLAAPLHVVPEATLERKTNRKGPRLDVGNVALRIRRAVGGTELESLLEYSPGDPLRAIDWKATAKRRHPVTRLYQPERSQTLWFVLDASRTMAAAIGAGQAAASDSKDGGALPSEAGPDALPEGPDGEARTAKTRFDVALEALLVVADGALRAGDQVGVLVHGDALDLVIPPGRGRGHYRRLVDTLSGAHARRVQFDVRGLVGQLERRARKRSLLVLFTDLENETHGEALYEHASVLTRRHLVLCVSLDDSITRTLADAPTHDGDRGVFARTAAIDMLRERTELTHKLEKRKVLVLTADEAGLASATLDRYLDVKTRGLL